MHPSYLTRIDALLGMHATRHIISAVTLPFSRVFRLISLAMSRGMPDEFVRYVEEGHMDTEEDESREVERILDERMQHGRLQYLVRCVGGNELDDEWMDASELDADSPLIDRYQLEKAAKAIHTNVTNKQSISNNPNKHKPDANGGTLPVDTSIPSIPLAPVPVPTPLPAPLPPSLPVSSPSPPPVSLTVPAPLALGPSPPDMPPLEFDMSHIQESVYRQRCGKVDGVWVRMKKDARQTHHHTYHQHVHEHRCSYR